MEDKNLFYVGQEVISKITGRYLIITSYFSLNPTFLNLAGYNERRHRQGHFIGVTDGLKPYEDD